MTKRIIFFASLFFLVASCGKKVLIEETHTFDNNCWLRFEPEVFSVPVDNTECTHTVALTLRYDTSIFDHDELPLVVDFFLDSAELHNFTPYIRLRNAKGLLRGTTIGSYCTVTDTIDRIRTYNKAGVYTYRIKQRTSKYEIYGINSLTMRVVEND